MAGEANLLDMRIRLLSLIASISVLVALVPTAAAPAQEVAPASPACVKAGYGETDATWNVGASAGQYAGERFEDDESSTGMDPHAQQVRRAKSYGVQSRLSVRAIAVQGCNGEMAVLVKNDNYLAQDFLQRRVGQLLAGAGSDIGYEDILVAASHNHSSPYLVSPSPGVALFQDVFDPRMLEWHARRTAEAIMAAEADLQPATMGATEITHEIYKSNIPGPAKADDGTPAAYPRSFGDEKVVVLRFDNADTGRAIASWVNFGQHPESLDTTDLISADYLGALERMVDRETGAPMVFSQADVGSSEGPYENWDAPPKWLPDGTRRAWAHVGFAQTERGVRYLANSIIDGFNQVGANAGTVPVSGNFEVGMYNGWIPGPISHPYPSVWNCKNEENVEGDPRVGVAPTCESPPDEFPKPPWSDDPQVQTLWETLKQQGVPVPDHYDGPGFGALEENARIRLQAVRFGDVILGSCACEAQVDLILNFESRADDQVGNIWDGYDWNCRREGYVPGAGEPTDGMAPADDPAHIDRQWTCDWPDSGGTRQFTFSDYDYERMQAEIHNDAEGWNDPTYAPYANSEPYRPSEIKGNFTKEELGGVAVAQPDPEAEVLPTEGYKLAVGIGHAGDYTGYTVSYREYQNRDTYRKALTSYGPHTADYMSTNLVYMAQALKGGPDVVADDPYNKLQAADEARQVAFSEAAGRAIGAAYDAWYAALPGDANPGQILEQPQDIQRFDAASFTWTGGSNAVDNPRVIVQREEGDGWVDYADQSGEVQTFLQFPAAVEGAVTTYSGQEQWEWTANFEAFNFGPRTDIDPRGSQTPAGNYRFVVQGRYRDTLEDKTYELISDPFAVSRWNGIKVEDFRKEPTGVSFAVAGHQSANKTTVAPGLPAPEIRYPRTYDAHPVIRFIRDDGGKDICKTCTFRPWATGSDVATATVTVERADGAIEQVAAIKRDGRWHADVALYDGDSAYVDQGGVVDTFGEINGEGSGRIAGSGTRPTEPTEPPAPAVTQTTLTGPSSAQYSDEGRLEATLTDTEGRGVPGAEIIFELRGADALTTAIGTTNEQGVAVVSRVFAEKPGAYELTARFAGNDSYLPSATIGPFVVDKEDTTLRLTSSGKGKNTEVVARLSDADSDGSGIEGRVIEFFADGEPAGSASTDADGVARLQPAPRDRSAKSWQARFDGDDFYRASASGTQP